MDLFLLREDNGYDADHICSMIDGLIGIIQRMREEIHAINFEELPEEVIPQLEDLRELSEWAIHYQLDESSDEGSLSTLSPPSSPGSVSWSPVVPGLPTQFADMAGENMSDRE